MDSSSNVRRSSRIASNTVNSPAPRTTRKTSTSSSINENTDTSPPPDRRKSRRLSTDSNNSVKSKPVPIRTRRDSKTLDEEERPATPVTPGRALRRTRRSSSTQDTEIIKEEEVPVRRSTRRRPSTDTENDPEVLSTKSVTTRRRRSSSVEEREEEVIKETKSKTRKLFSEDNQLEPIDEAKETNPIKENTEVTNKTKEFETVKSIFSPSPVKASQSSSPLKSKQDEESEDSSSSFTLKLDQTEDKINTSSPGSNKENSSTNVQTEEHKNNQNVSAANVASKSMDLDDNVFESPKTVKQSSVIKYEKSLKSKNENTPNVSDESTQSRKTLPDNSPKKDVYENAGEKNLIPFVPLLKMKESQIVSSKSPKENIVQLEDEGNSSESSIVLIEDDLEETIEKSSVPTNCKGSKRRRISDGASNIIIKQLTCSKESKLDLTTKSTEETIASVHLEDEPYGDSSLNESERIKFQGDGSPRPDPISPSKNSNIEETVVLDDDSNEALSEKNLSEHSLNKSSQNRSLAEKQEASPHNSSKIDASHNSSKDESNKNERNFDRCGSVIENEKPTDHVRQIDEISTEKSQSDMETSSFINIISSPAEKSNISIDRQLRESKKETSLEKLKSIISASEKHTSPVKRISVGVLRSPAAKSSISIDENSSASDKEASPTKRYSLRTLNSPANKSNISIYGQSSTPEKESTPIRRVTLGILKSPTAEINTSYDKHSSVSEKKESPEKRFSLRNSKSPSGKPDSNDKEQTCTEKSSKNISTNNVKEDGHSVGPENSKSPEKSILNQKQGIGRQITIHNKETEHSSVSEKRDSLKPSYLKRKHDMEEENVFDCSKSSDITETFKKNERNITARSLSALSPKPKSPMKTKLEKMEKCGVKITQKMVFKIDEETNRKFNEFLEKNLTDNLFEEGTSDESETNDFLDDMAEEGDEDTPSEDSNAIIEKGESIHSTDTEEDEIDDNYDLNDSFIVDDDAEPSLLSGEENFFDEKPKSKEAKLMKNRKRILQVYSSSDDNEEKNNIPQFKKNKRISEKVKRTGGNILDGEIVQDQKIETLPEPKENFKEEIKTIPEEQVGEKTKPMLSEQVDEYEIDFDEDSSNDDAVENDGSFNISKSQQKIQSLLDVKCSTPNMSMVDKMNTSEQYQQQNNSSSIIIHENIQIAQINSKELSEKIKQVVEVFSSGIKSNIGNVSFNLSLDYHENVESPKKKNKLDDSKMTVDNDTQTVEIKEKSMEKHEGIVILQNTSIKTKNEEVVQEQVTPKSVSDKDSKEKIKRKKRNETENTTSEAAVEHVKKHKPNVDEIVENDSNAEKKKKKRNRSKNKASRNIEKKNNETVFSSDKHSERKLKKKNVKKVQLMKASLIDAANDFLLSKNSEHFGFKCENIPGKNKSKKLKRLQSEPKPEFETIKKFSLKPSSSIGSSSWIVNEEDNLKPSTSNATKCTFNLKKINEKDFKNQMLYDPRIKRETSKSLVRKKGYNI